jgi:hypothetical protein
VTALQPSRHGPTVGVQFIFPENEGAGETDGQSASLG